LRRAVRHSPGVAALIVRHKMEALGKSQCVRIDFAGWDELDHWEPGGAVFAGIQHATWTSSDGDRVVSCANDFCNDIRGFADEYLRALQGSIGPPELYKDKGEEGIGFFGRWAIWFGRSAALTFDLRASLRGGSAEYVDVYLTFFRRPIGDQTAWRNKLIGNHMQLPDVEPGPSANGGPAKPLGDSRVGGGPPSVS
jgi:hypothetical protein